jgi:branched-chain amino acid transport system ATP-binding protein
VSILNAQIPEAGYGKKIVLRNISFDVNDGDVVALIGPNGAGKSTLLKVLAGLLKVPSGSVRLQGQDIMRLAPEERVQRGLCLVPQGNRVFSELSVKENLEIGGYLLKEKKEVQARMDFVLDLFPQMKELMHRNAGQLSGGEKQQLALARAMMLRPSLLLLDEPSLGLSPGLVTRALNTIEEVNAKTKTAIIIVEQKVLEVMRVSRKVFALRMGEIVFSGTSDELKQGDTMKQVFLV